VNRAGHEHARRYKDPPASGRMTGFDGFTNGSGRVTGPISNSAMLGDLEVSVWKTGGLIRARIFIASDHGSFADTAVSRIGLVQENGERADTNRGITNAPVRPRSNFSQSRDD